MKRAATVTFVCIVLVSACSSEPSLTEYAEEVEHLVLTMNAQLDAVDAELAASSQDLQALRSHADQRVALRNEFLTALGALTPPRRVEELHNVAYDVVARLTEAESELAAELARTEDLGAARNIRETAAGQAARAADADAVAICKAAEAEFNATEEQALAEGVPWVPAEMKEVVRVAFLCERADRP
jgi:hypothetical protein